MTEKTTAEGRFTGECHICGCSGVHPSWQARNLRADDDEQFTYFECSGCGCLQISAPPRDLASYYTEDYYSFNPISERKQTEGAVKGALRSMSATLGTSSSIPSTFLQRVFSFPIHHEWFRKAGVTHGSRILDVGCGSGSLLMRIRKEGFRNVMGADPFLTEDIRYKNGLLIRKASLEDLAGEGKVFDFIMMHHSLEHIPDQHAAFGCISRILSPGGTALLRVPVAGSLAWQTYGTDWIQLDSPRHLYLHSEKSMDISAKRAGLAVYDCVYDSLSLQFVGSELCKRGVPIGEHKRYMEEHGGSLFSDADMKRWEEEESIRCNRDRTGDMACFYIRHHGG